MRISVVVPTLNSNMYLSECLKSVLEQGHDDVEVVIQDGGSTDSTLSVAQHYAYHYPRQVVIEQSKDKNEPDAINKGFKKATGSILAWLDSDDVYINGCLNAVSKLFEYEGAKWVYGKCKIIDEHGHEVRAIVTKAKEFLQKHYSFPYLEMVDFIPQPSAFISRKAWEEIGELNTDEKLVFDYEYWLRLGKVHEPTYIDRYLSCWRAHGKSLSVQHFKQEAQDARRIARTYTHNPLLRLGQGIVYGGTVALYSVK